MKAKFQISELLGIGMTLVVLGIGIAYGLQVMGDVRDDLASCETGWTYNTTSQSCQGAGAANYTATVNTEFNATSSAIEGVSKIPEKLPTIATVIVASVIIGILVTYLWARFQ